MRADADPSQPLRRRLAFAPILLPLQPGPPGRSVDARAIPSPLLTVLYHRRTQNDRTSRETLMSNIIAPDATVSPNHSAVGKRLIAAQRRVRPQTARPSARSQGQSHRRERRSVDVSQLHALLSAGRQARPWCACGRRRWQTSSLTSLPASLLLRPATVILKL